MSARVKICGLTTPESMEAALDAGADYVGLVFYPASPRHIEFKVARELAAMASGTADLVALVVDPSNRLIGEIASEIGPDFIQLHGAESPDRVVEIAELSQARTIKALGVTDHADIAVADSYIGVADLIMFDAKPPPNSSIPGGNGIAFDWSVLHSVRPGLDYMLSGGLTPENVGEAIRQTGAPAVDVSSGVERSRGVKDAALIRAFIEAAKSV
ncbi:MAG: phosphoribosylanthranilate isomerase [Hyphomicrobiaceae bacterium]